MNVAIQRSTAHKSRHTFGVTYYIPFRPAGLDLPGVTALLQHRTFDIYAVDLFFTRKIQLNVPLAQRHQLGQIC